MMGEERRESNEGEKDSDEKNRSLSREGWIMLLSGEINKVEMKLFLLENHGNVILLTLFLGGVAAVIAIVQIGMVQALFYFILIFEGLMITFALYNWLYRYPRVQKRLKRLVNIREPIISGELTDFSEIRKEWKEYIKKYYRKLLEKSELDEEEKELNESKECSEEKALEKNFKEQKEVLQVPQSDIGDIKESLQKIEAMIEGTSKFSSWCVLGGVYIAIGSAMMGISASFSSALLKAEGIFLGLFIVLAGMFMIKGAYYAGTNANRYPNASMNALKELRHTNRWLFYGFLFMACAILTLIALFKFSFGL